MLRSLPIVLLLLLVTGILFYRNPPAPAFTTETYTIAPHETVRVDALRLQITNEGCGRQWTEQSEQVFCALVIKWKDSTIRTSQVFKPVYIGPIKLQVLKANPWGAAQDSLAPGACKVQVTKLDDISR